MEKTNSKTVSIVTLFIAIIALSVGNAAFLTQNNLKNNNINKQNNTTNKIKYASNSIECTKEPQTTAIVNNIGNIDDTTWSGIIITLKKPTDSVTCTATIENTTTKDSYLKSIELDHDIICTTIKEDNTTDNKNNDMACGNVQMTVDVSGHITPNITSSAHIGLNDINTENKINKNNGTHKVTVVVKYVEGETLSNSAVQVTLPQININYEIEK